MTLVHRALSTDLHPESSWDYSLLAPAAEATGLGDSVAGGLALSDEPALSEEPELSDEPALSEPPARSEDEPASLPDDEHELPAPTVLRRA
jgi:hypothetical protein